MKKEANSQSELSEEMNRNVSSEEVKRTVSSESELSEETSKDMDTDEDTSVLPIEMSSVNECLQKLGESPLKPASKTTLSYTKQKIHKVQSTLKRKILDLSAAGEETVRA